MRGRCRKNPENFTVFTSCIRLMLFVLLSCFIFVVTIRYRCRCCCCCRCWHMKCSRSPPTLSLSVSPVRVFWVSLLSPSLYLFDFNTFLLFTFLANHLTSFHHLNHNHPHFTILMCSNKPGYKTNFSNGRNLHSKTSVQQTVCLQESRCGIILKSKMCVESLWTLVAAWN